MCIYIYIERERCIQVCVCRYVLVTSITPLRVYFYEEGLVRFAAEKYNKTAAKGGKKQQYMTNTSINKKFTHLDNLTWTFRRLAAW